MLSFSSIKKEIKAFVNLPANKQVIYLLLVMLLVCGSVVYSTNRKIDDINVQKDKELLESRITIKQLELKLDTCNIEKYNQKIEYLNRDIARGDSLLKNSEQIRNSIKPLIKKINKKIDEVNQ